MNKSDLIYSVSRKTGYSVNSTEKTISTFVETIVEAFTRGERVSIVGLGRFRPVRHKPRRAHNPRTGAPVLVPARTRIKFTPGQKLNKIIENKP